jgi:hypothetical protein
MNRERMLHYLLNTVSLKENIKDKKGKIEGVYNIN